MHNHDDKYPSRPGFEPGTPRLQAPVDTNEPSGPAGRMKENTKQPMSSSVHHSSHKWTAHFFIILKFDLDDH